MAGIASRSAKGKAKEEEHPLTGTSPLDVLDERADAAPLDEQEQAAVVAKLRESNDKSNYLFRGALLVILGLVFVAYVEPIPEYLMGTHPENHLTLFFGKHGVDATHDDLVKLPAAPIYLLFFSWSSTLLYLVGFELAEQMGLIKTKGHAFPSQPHLFGTCPNWLVPILNDLRWHPWHANPGARRAAGDVPPNFIQTMPHRQLYIFFLWIASLPLPCLVFGAGAFVNSFWWGLTPTAIGLVTLCLGMIFKSERETLGLAGMKYAFKGA